MSNEYRRSISGKIIVADDDPVFLRLLREAAARCDHSIEIMQYDADKIPATEQNCTATILINPEFVSGVENGEMVIRKLRKNGHRGRILISSANISVRQAVLLVRAGADDIMIKPVGKEAIDRIMSAHLAPAQNPIDTDNSPETIQNDFDEFIGNSAPMKRLYEMIEAVAASAAPVFITGESGTGKELAARAVHANGSRRDKPFIALNCSAIPENLMESEIFGHVKGAFTGAGADRAGAAELADGGTLFLDELCEMDVALQAKLLRFIQSGSVQRVGDSRTLELDIRFICATNRDPAEEISIGNFRADLFYRLNVLPLRLVALRERSEDILRIAKACLARFAREEGAAFLKFTDDAVSLLRDHPWPGNVRQLQNTIRRAVVLNRGDEITSGMLQATLADEMSPARPVGAPGPGFHQMDAAPAGTGNLIQPLAIQERNIIENAIQRCGGNIVETARLLAVSPSTIYRKINSWPAQPAEPGHCLAG